MISTEVITGLGSAKNSVLLNFPEFARKGVLWNLGLQFYLELTP